MRDQKLSEAYWPYFIVRLQTNEGPEVELRFHKEALESLAEEVKKYLSKEAPN